MQQTSVERYIQQQAEIEADLDIVDLVIDSNTEETRLDVETEVLADIDASQVNDQIHFAEGIDGDIAEVFIEEADEVLQDLQMLIPQWLSQHDDDSLSVIRRHFHTLKGSGRMAGASVIGELAWSVENILNLVIEGNLPNSPALEQLLVDSHQLIPELLNRFTSAELSSTDSTEELIARSEQLVTGSSHVTETETETETETSLLENKELLQIFRDEALQYLATFKEALIEADWPFRLRPELLQAAHSLKGSANVAMVTPIANIATQLDHTLRSLYEQELTLNHSALTALNTLIENLTQHVLSLPSQEISEADMDSLHALLEQITADQTTDQNIHRIDPETLAIYLEETDEYLGKYRELLQNHLQTPDNSEQKSAIINTLQSLTESAEFAGLQPLVALYQSISTLVTQGNLTDDKTQALIADGSQHLNEQIKNLVQDQALNEVGDYQQAVIDFLQQQDTIDTESDIASQESQESQEQLFAIPTHDLDLLEAFTEEYIELLESSENAIKLWQQDNSNSEATEQLQRDLHTIKGGSRLIGLTPIANLTHQTESLVTMVLEGKHQADTPFFTLLQRCQDRLADISDQLKNNNPLTLTDDLIAELASFTQEELPQQQTSVEVEPPAETQSDESRSPAAENDSPIPVNALLTEAKPLPASANEQVRVRSDLLDFLTNFAGEVNISRDRVSQQNTAIRQQLTEMEATVQRLQDQLRKLEMETEAQILFRYEDEVLRQQSEFDPLELDRFSKMQHLSRGLNESVSDLNDISLSLDTIVRESDTILLQQSRLSTDLQQGLMNTRLLPFNGLVPRFERIVRQTNAELGKQSELTVYGADRELDRTILDHIVAPIEHIIRNAIAHGVEAPEQRQHLGKDEAAQLTLTITRDGSELLITLSDDGQGIDVEKVRYKAIENGLINPNNMPRDEELIQLILNSGFSTADNVSQLAGRGVGMDVVNNEIRALKGRLTIQSISGQGTTFSIRLPLTLSIMQALLIGSGDQQYAIPLASVHAGERMKVSDVKELMNQGDQARYEYNGTYYQFLALQNLLGHPLSLPENPDIQLPILLFSSGEIHVALLVDAINNSREIVLKSVGEQISHIAPISGATILGDGQVVFILDIPSLVNSAQEAIFELDETHQATMMQIDEHRAPLAMVVDDSITMRKASGNLLKRHGFDIITARDGIDAVALLNEHVPDIILLDVEMPRMDGFEFATLIRNDDELSQLPIIMITSRSGEKHRNRAESIGVNAYMGKPYQEIELVETLKNLLGDDYPENSD